MSKRKKKDQQGDLRRAERKIHPYADNTTWYGELTPSEALAVIDDGAAPASDGMYDREDFQSLVDAGDGEPRHFYFTPSRHQMRRWASKFPDPKG